MRPRGHQHGEDSDGPIEARGTHAAGINGGHLAVVIQPPECKHHSKKQAYWHDHTEILQCTEADEPGHHLARILVVGRALQHHRELVRQQQHQQHAGHGCPALHHFAQNVAIESSSQNPLRLY